MSKQIMCHVVAGYPNAQDCLKLMQGMSKAGVAAIEVQIPFSDPIADGETIMHANDVAVEHDMTTEGSFSLIGRARQAGVNCDIKVMSYFQKVNHLGLREFCQAAQAVGVTGLIIPDLPYDSPEYTELNKYAHAHGLEIIPVVSPGMPDDRLKSILKKQPKTVYVTSQRGITGNDYTENTQLDELVGQIRTKTGQSQVMLGFGISSASDVDQALRLADIAVVGSAIVRELDSDGVGQALLFINRLIGAAK